MSGFYDLYENKYGYLSSKYFDKVGFQNYTDSTKVNEFYLIKYISKDFEFGTRFYHSRNLNKPIVEVFHDNLNEFDNFPFTFKNNYCKMVTIAK